MSGAAPAADAAGDLYVMTGNGTFDANTGGPDFGDSFLRLTKSESGLAVTDYFTPFDQALLNANDGDLGSGAPMLLPETAGSAEHPNLLVGCGKEGIVYVVDRDNMGHFNSNDNNQIVQWFGLGSPTLSMPAWFNNRVYYHGINDTLKAFSVTNSQMSWSPASRSTVSFAFPGATPSISADNANNGIAWEIQTDAFGTNGPAVLRAYDAADLSRQLYTSGDAGDRDRLGPAQKFAVPTIANGKVYVGAGFQLSVFGTLGAPVIATQPQDQTIDAGTDVIFNVGAGGSPPFGYQWRFNGKDLDGATNAWLSLTNVPASGAGDYTVRVANSYDTALSEAARLIVNSPPVPPKLTINSQLEIALEGDPGRGYAIEYLADLDLQQNDWIVLTTLTLTNTIQTVTDPQGTNAERRFYRAVADPF
jgi:hypothetical protein